MSISSISALLQQGARSDLMSLEQGRAPTLVDSIVQRLPSSARTEYLPFLGESPQLTKHDLGEMTTSDQLSDVSFSVQNEEFRAKLSLHMADLEDDQTNGIRMRIQQMLRVAQQLEDKLLIDAITGSDNGFDGTTFFSNSHTASYSSGATVSHDNLLGGTGTTAAQIQADFATALSTCMGYTGGNGEPFLFYPEKVVIAAPWGIRQTMQEAVFGNQVGNTSNAQTMGLQVEVHYNARLSDANDWYLFVVNGAQRPFYLFDRKPLSVDVIEDDAERLVHVVATKRCKLALGHYALGAKVVNS